MIKQFLSALAVAALLVASASTEAATWAPLSSGAKARSIEVTSSTNFAIPAVLAAKGGAIHFTLVGGGEGGHASRATCDDYAIQGGKGGDGGEVIELDITMLPGQCTAGIGISVGAGGRGGYRAGYANSTGDSGGATIITCAGVTMSTALGGGRRADTVTAPRSAKGGTGGVVMNTLDQATLQSIDQRNTAITAAGEGQSGRGGYGSGGGGGGASLAFTGSSVKPDGTVLRKATTRNAPMGKSGYGAGAGAGPAEYSSEATYFPAENAVQYGSGGGGGAAMCGGTPSVRDGGNGFTGMVKLQWSE